jgi:SpoVK/Ycf46/Vps4 family AAA+-type ATPase
MPSAEQLKALLQSHADGDDSRFYAVAMQLAASEAKKGHSKVAQELRAVIDKARGRSALPVGKAIPISRPREELGDLLSFSESRIRLSDLILQARIRRRLQRILKEQRHFDELQAHGLRPRQKLLLTGPPGCGKTMTASALAGELGIPLFVVRLDGLITKYLGESVAKLRLIFDAIARTRAVYLFDEFDSIGSQRSYVNDVGEMRRVLNSFLMYIEQDRSTSIIVAATNSGQSLDSALFRRFDEIIEYELPTKDLIAEMMTNRLAAYPVKDVNFVTLAEHALGLSYAEISRACDDAIKSFVIGRKESISHLDLVTPLAEMVGYGKHSNQ